MVWLHDPGQWIVLEMEQQIKAEQERQGLKDPAEEHRKRLPIGKLVLLDVARTLGVLLTIILILSLFSLVQLFGRSSPGGG